MHTSGWGAAHKAAGEGSSHPARRWQRDSALAVSSQEWKSVNRQQSHHHMDPEHPQWLTSDFEGSVKYCAGKLHSY